NVSFSRKQKVFSVIQIEFVQTFQFLYKNYGIYNHSVSDEVNRVFVKHPRWDCTQNVFYAINFQGVSSVWGTLKTCDNIVVLCEHIDNFSFAFVAPLQSK